MNSQILNIIASGSFGASLVTFFAFFIGFAGASFEGAALLLLSALVGFGVSRYYEVTNMVSGKSGVLGDAKRGVGNTI